jgi:hypothetical protein
MSCFQIEFAKDGNPTLTFNLDAFTSLNGYDAYQFTYFGTTYFIWHDAIDNWYIGPNFNSIVGIVALYKANTDQCPTGGAPPWEATTLDFLKTSCPCPQGVECDVEDRWQQEFKSIKLPKICQEENRGITDCCCEYLIFVDGGTTSWKNDKTSAWIKVSDPTDLFFFRLYKNNQLTAFQPTAQPFINEPNAYFCTIDWNAVFASGDGPGCYELRIDYNIAGITGGYTWGVYKVYPFTIQDAVATARVRAEFDGYHEIEGINFTGSGVVTDLRFRGYIGNRQPNMEIDNIIYSNREMKRVIRENLNSYEIITDPSHKCITQPMIDLILLSENNLYISDYNAHNHDYCLQDKPVIVKESPEVEYYDFSRKAKVTCIVEDKFKNKRTYY